MCMLTFLDHGFLKMSFPLWKNIFLDEKLLFLCFSVPSEAKEDVARSRTNDEGCAFQSWKSPQRKIHICSSEPLTVPLSKPCDPLHLVLNLDIITKSLPSKQKFPI